MTNENTELERFRRLFSKMADMPENPFHPLVWILGEPEIGENVSIGGLTEINASRSRIVIGDNCDIASFVSLNCVDSHLLCLGIANEASRKEIVLEQNVFVGSHSVIKGGAHIGHHSVIAAGTVVDGRKIPPFSLVSGNPMTVREGYYEERVTREKPQLDGT
jgi:acetyltransferase-like isoleucine patch superfamily enzyme